MTAPNLHQYLAMLETNPFDDDAIAGLRDIVQSKDAERMGEDPIRALEMARALHDSRGEYYTISGLLEVESFLVADDIDFLIALYRELARIQRDELLDDEAALATWRLVLEWVPEDPDAEEAIEELEHVSSNYRAVADRFLEAANNATDPSLRAGLLARAAAVIWKHKKKGKNKEVDELFEAAIQSDPGNARVGRLWAYTFRLRKKLVESGAVLFRVAELAADKDQKVSLYAQAGRDFAQGGDVEQAAAAFEQVQDFRPGDEEALRHLVPFFTERQMYDHLAALYDDALRSKRRPDAEAAFLLQIGMVHWRMRNAPADAEPYFSRLRKIDAAHPGMLAFYREHLGESHEQANKLVTILNDAQRSTGGGEQKLELAIEAARKAESSEHTERAIDAWKAVQRQDGTNEEAREALKRLYRKGEKWNALAEALKQEVEACGAEQKDRKLGLLRELVAVYKDHLRLDAMVASTYNAIRELAPEDDDALDRLAATYEQMGRWNDLVGVLTKKADQSTGEDKIALLMRVARLWIDRFANFNKATEPLEQVLLVDPKNREAIELLKDIYNRKRSWKQLFDVQLREIELEPDAERRLSSRVELAKLAGEKLHRHAEAIALWKEIVAEDPTVDGALDALEKLGEREKDWDAVVVALERRLELATSDADRIKHLTKLGTVHGDQRKDPVAAADAWTRILRIEPKNGRALRTLREAFLAARDWDGLEGMYAEANDWEGLVDVLGSTADKSEDAETKIAMSFRAASVYEDRIGEPARAFRSYERVLSVDPRNTKAAAKLAAIYEKDEKWPRLANVLEILVDAPEGETSTAERVRLLGRLRDISLTRLADAAGAFRWAKRAYELAPTDDAVIAGLERAADASNAHADLAKIYQARLSATSSAEETVGIRRRLASLAGEKLGSPDEAIAQLAAIVAANPDDTETVEALDRLYRKENRHRDRRDLLKQRITRAEEPAERFMLLGELAQLEETALGDKAAAAKARRDLLEIDPTDRGALEALDRLLVDLGQDAELEEILERRIEVADATPDKVSLFTRLGDLRSKKLGKLDDAVMSYESAITLDGNAAQAAAGLASIESSSPKHAIEVGRLLEPYYERKGMARELSAVLEKRLAQTTDETERRELRLRIADLASSSLGDPAAAYASLEAAFLDRPDDVDLWDRLTDAAEAANRMEDLGKAFLLGLESGSVEGPDAVELARRAANVYDISLGRPAEAEELHKRVLAADTADEAAFVSLKELYTNQERWDDLQALYRTRIDATVDAEQKVELLRQVCFVFEEILDDPERAIQGYEELLTLEPDLDSARRALDKLYRRTNRHRQLLEILGYDLDRAEGQKAVELAYEIGTLHESRLGELERSVDFYERVLETNPSHMKTVEALERLLEEPKTRHRVARILEPIHERTQAWQKLARDLDIELEVTDDRGSRIDLLTRLARLFDDRIRDRDAAFAALAKAVDTDPSDADVRAQLAQVSEARRDHASRAAVLEAVVGKTTGYTRTEILAEIAQLWDESVGDVDKAKAAYQQLIASDAENPDVVLPASRALERLHLATGDEKALADDLRRQVAFETDTHVRSALLVRLGDLFELSLDDVPSAIEAHKERLELDDADVGALVALERLYERTEAWQELVDVLRRREALTDSPLEQRDLVMKIAALEETKLGRIDDAIDTYGDVLARHGRDPQALEALTRLHRATERWQDLFDDYEMLLELESDPARRAELRIAGADILRTKLGETERALEAYSEVLELVPGHAGAIEALEDLLTGTDANAAIVAARLVAPEFRRAQRHSDLISALDVLSRSDDPAERLDSLRQASLVAEFGIADLDQAFLFESRAAELALSEPELPAILERIDQLARNTEKFREQAELLQRIAPEIMDGDVQLATTMKVAEVARHSLKDLDLAATWYRKALDIDPEHRPALDALDSLLAERGDFGDLLETVRRKAEIAQTPEERVENLVRVADICENRLNDVASAIDALEQVLNEQPFYGAYESLERLYTKAERHSDLASLYERMLDQNIGPAKDVRHRLAAIQDEKLGDQDAALESLRTNLEGGVHAPTVQTLEQMLAKESHRAQAAALLEPVFTQQMAWPKVVEVIEARLTVETDPEERKIILRRLGGLHEDYREDLNSAFDAYARLFREDITDESVWDVLMRLARATNGYARLADTYAAALAEHDVDDDVTAKLAELTGRLYDERVAAPERAAPFFARAHRFQPENPAVFELLESSLSRTRQWSALVDAYREQADVAPSDEARIDLLHRLALTQARELSNVEEAVAAHRQVLEIHPEDAISVQALDDIFTAHERWQDLADLLRFRIDGASQLGLRQDLRHRLGVLLATKLDDIAGAIDAFEEVLQEGPHAPSVAALEQLVMNVEHRLRITQILEPVYRSTDEWRKLVAIWEAQLELHEEASDKLRLLADIGRAHEERGRDLGLAFHAWSRAFTLDPNDVDARQQVDRIAGMASAWNELVGAYESAIAAATDPALKSELLLAVAKMHDEKRGDPRSAIVTYERLLEHDSSDTSPLDALEALHTLVGDWNGLVSVLQRKVELVYDAVERADILRRAASVHEDLLGDRQAAIAAYRRAAEEDASDTLSLESLDRLLDEAGDHAGLADVLERRLEIETEPDTQVDVGVRLAELCESTLGQPDRAVTALVRVRGIAPEHVGALESLTRLYEKLENWPDLLDVLRARAELASGSAKVELLHRAGEVLEKRMDDVSEALETYGSALELDGSYAPSLEALMRIVRLDDHRERAAELVEPLLRAQNRWDDVATVLSLRADATSDPIDKRDRLRELAVVHESGRNDARAAFDATRAALTEDASDPSLFDDVERLGAQLGAYGDVADAFAASASSAQDPETARALYVRLARICEEQLKDDARAIAANERALEQMGDDEELLASLDRLYTRVDQAPDLARVLERRIDSAADADARSTLALRLGALRRDRFADLRGAFTSFSEVLEANPSDATAIAAIEGLAAEPAIAADAVEALDAAHRRTGALDRLPALYDIRFRLAESVGEKVRILQDRAALEERDLGRPSDALDAVVRAFELDPRDDGLLADVERLADQTGAWSRLAGVPERILEQEASDRDLVRTLALRSASWYLEKLGDRAAAEACYRRAIAADPEAFEAHDGLTQLLRADGRQKELVAALVAWAENDSDEHGKKEHLREAAVLSETALGDLASAGRCYASLLDVDGADLDALAGLSRIRASEGKHDEVAELLVRRIDAEMSPDVRLGLRRELAALYAGPLADVKKATQAFEGVLDEAPTDLGAISELETLYEKQKRWDDLRGLIERRFDLAASDADRIDAKVRLARLEEQAFGRRAQAIEQLHEILQLDPNHAQAQDELERLLAAEKNWDELVSRLESRIAATSGTAAVSHLERLAAVHRNERKAPADAIATYERILAIDSRHETALRAVVELQKAAKNDAATVDALERLLAASDGAPAIAVALELASLADSKLNDAARAETALQRALSIDAADEGARAALKALYEKHQRFAQLAAMLEEEADRLEDPAKKVAAYQAVSKLRLEKLDDPGQAAAALEKASKLKPDDRELLLPLCDLYVRAGRGGEAVPVLRQIIASFGNKRTKELAGFHQRLGQALESAGDTAGALEQYDAAFKIDLTNVAVLRDLGKLTYRTGDYERSQKTFRALLLQKLGPDAGITKGDVYFYLGDMTAKSGDKAKAISMLERAVAEDKGHADATALIAQLKG